MGENKQQDKMTTAQIFIPTTNNQFQLELLNRSPVTSGCGVGALLQPGASPSYGADGKGLPGPVG